MPLCPDRRGQSGLACGGKNCFAATNRQRHYFIKKRNTKTAKRIHVTIEISFIFPVIVFNTTYERIPYTIPSAILYENGIITIVKKAGMPSVGSLKLISSTALIIKKPTMIKAGVVAAAGMSKNSGENIKAMMNNAPVVIEVKPVRPPDATPDELSI